MKLWVPCKGRRLDASTTDAPETPGHTTLSSPALSRDLGSSICVLSPLASPADSDPVD